MNSAPNNAQTIRPNPNSGGLRSEACAILLLLMSAEASLQEQVGDDGCITILRTCIARIQQQYQVADCEVSSGIVWSESSLDAILRLLDYVKAEIQDKLNDLQSAEDLDLCVDRLTSPHKLC